MAVNGSLEDTIAAALAEAAAIAGEPLSPWTPKGFAVLVAVAVREWEAAQEPKRMPEDFSAVITDTEGNRLRVQRAQ